MLPPFRPSSAANRPPCTFLPVGLQNLRNGGFFPWTPRAQNDPASTVRNDGGFCYQTISWGRRARDPITLTADKVNILFVTCLRNKSPFLGPDRQVAEQGRGTGARGSRPLRNTQRAPGPKTRGTHRKLRNPRAPSRPKWFLQCVPWL